MSHESTAHSANQLATNGFDTPHNPAMDVAPKLFPVLPPAMGLLVLLGLSGCGVVEKVPIPWVGEREAPAAQVQPQGDWPVPLSNAPVLQSFEQAVINAPAGLMIITSGDGVFRAYNWAGDTRAVFLQPRERAWYGSQGLFFPGDFDHWDLHDGVTRAFIEEGTRDFATQEEALEWLTLHRPALVWTPTGLAGGWERRTALRQIVINLWQITIQGQPPTDLPQALPGSITIQSVPEFPVPSPREL